MRQVVLKIGAVLALMFTTILGAVWVTSTKAGPLPQTAAGYTTAAMPTPRRGGDLLLHLWYPAASDAPISLIAQNALFYGFHARRDANGDSSGGNNGAYPVIVLSHGSGGNAERLGWIAAHLAERGFIVAAVNHAGTTSQDSLPNRTVKPWERTGDVSDMLDFLADSAPLGIRPDLARVGILGFSLGGGTALLSAGAQLSKDQFIAYCADPLGKADCAWLLAGGVDFAQIDSARYESDMRDARIVAAVAVDPALTRAMTEGSLRAMTSPVQIVNLGTGTAIPAAMQADAAAKIIPSAQYLQIEGAAHFSFLARCSLFGKVMISIAGDDNICSDYGLRPRDSVQTQLKDDIGRFFEQVLHP